VTAGAIDCSKRFVSDMTYVSIEQGSNETLNNKLTHHTTSPITPASGGACFSPRWCELLVGRPLRNVRTVRVVHFSYSYPKSIILTRYRMGRIRPAPKISTPDYIGTGDSHHHTSSQSHRFILPLPSRPTTGKLRVRVGPI